jgi:hypothetical protein
MKAASDLPAAASASRNTKPFSVTLNDKRRAPRPAVAAPLF